MPLSLASYVNNFLYIYTSVFELVDVNYAVCLVVYPLKDLSWVWNSLICFIRPHYSLEAFVEGYRP